MRKAIKHLKEDIRDYREQKKHLSKEIKEDKDLINTLKKSAKPSSMSRYKNYSKKELQEHISQEKKLLKRKK